MVILPKHHSKLSNSVVLSKTRKLFLLLVMRSTSFYHGLWSLKLQQISMSQRHWKLHIWLTILSSNLSSSILAPLGIFVQDRVHVGRLGNLGPYQYKIVNRSIAINRTLSHSVTHEDNDNAKYVEKLLKYVQALECLKTLDVFRSWPCFDLL